MKLKTIASLVMAGVAIALALSLSVFLIQVFFKDPISRIVISLFTTSIFLLCRFLIYIFIIGGLLMVLMIHWVGWENVKFKLKQMHYRSALVAKDYYKETKRVKYDKFMGAMARHEQRGMEAEGPPLDVPLPVAETAGSAHPTGSEITYVDGKINGILRQYHDNGSLESEIGYEDGRYHGFYRTYYPDGRMHNEKTYRNGKLNGVFKAWDEDGSLFFEINYKDDKQHGPDRIYYRTGILQFEDTYVEGKRTVRKTYDEGGKLKFVQNYR